MSNSVRVTYRGMQASEILEAVISEKMEGLRHLCADIASCHVVVERREAQKGLHVLIDLDVPRKRLVVNHPAGKSGDGAADVRQAFDAARRMLVDHLDRLQGEVKRHGDANPPP